MNWWYSWDHILSRVRKITIILIVIYVILEVSQAQRLKLIGYLDSLHGKHKCLPPWEQQLKIAQKVLFNHELFMQVCGWLVSLLYVFGNVYVVITRCLPSKDFLSV